MIAQTAPQGAPRFVMQMSEHTALTDQFADAFGNVDFEQVEDDAARYLLPSLSGLNIKPQASTLPVEKQIVTLTAAE